MICYAIKTGQGASLKSEAEEPGGALGVNAPPLFVPGEKVPFFGKVPYFHRIKVPFMQNLSAIFGQCPLTFNVLPRPLTQIGFTEFRKAYLNFDVLRQSMDNEKTGWDIRDHA